MVRCDSNIKGARNDLLKKIQDEEAKKNKTKVKKLTKQSSEERKGFREEDGDKTIAPLVHSKKRGSGYPSLPSGAVSSFDSQLETKSLAPKSPTSPATTHFRTSSSKFSMSSRNVI